jgi:carbonic anhydrase
VLACMDARLLPLRILDLDEGDAHVIRNAGGVVTDDAIRSLAVSQHMLGTEEVIVLQHTDCGMTKITDEEFAGKLEREAGERPSWPVHSFDDVEQSVRDSLERIRSSPFLVGTKGARGFVYDVANERLREVAGTG